MPMDTIKLPKNFILSRESIKETLSTFKANKSIADVTREVFQTAAPASSARHSTPTPTLVPMSRGSHSATSRMSVPPKALASFKVAPAPKEVPMEPIVVSGSTESSLTEGSRSASFYALLFYFLVMCNCRSTLVPSCHIHVGCTYEGTLSFSLLRWSFNSIRHH